MFFIIFPRQSAAVMTNLYSRPRVY